MTYVLKVNFYLDTGGRERTEREKKNLIGTIYKILKNLYEKIDNWADANFTMHKI